MAGEKDNPIFGQCFPNLEQHIVALTLQFAIKTVLTFALEDGELYVGSAQTNSCIAAFSCFTG